MFARFPIAAQFLLVALGCGGRTAGEGGTSVVGRDSGGGGDADREGAGDGAITDAQSNAVDATLDGRAAVVDGSVVCAMGVYGSEASCGCGDGATACPGDGQPPECVDSTTDVMNCGGCAVECTQTAACLDGACGEEPRVLVAAATGCMSIRIAYDLGAIYWSDLGHGLIASIPTSGGPVTTIASGQAIAAVQQGGQGPLLWPEGPIATSLLVKGGVAYWIGASTAAVCDDAGVCEGGAGTAIMSAAAGSAPKTILDMSMDPPPSPVSEGDAQYAIERPGVAPPINAIALSPDGSTLYFAAGTRFYSLPSSGAGVVSYVGFTFGPEHGVATALTTDGSNLYYPVALGDGTVEMASVAGPCDPEAAEALTCPIRLALGQSSLVYDTILVRSGLSYFANASFVDTVSIAAALDGSFVGAPSFSRFGTDLTGFALGTRYLYFGETGPDGAGYIEKKLPASVGSTTEGSALIIARNQPLPSSFVTDGTNVYWATRRCDINYLADSPQ